MEEPQLDEALGTAAEATRPEGSKRRFVVRAIPVAVVAVAVIATYGHITRYGLMGFDSYPIIITSRVQSWGDLVGNFTEELMDGRYTGDFYRPVLNLSFALDYAIWGLRPAGYQLTNLVLLFGAALGLYGVMGRLMGGGSRLAPMVAALVFVLHPMQYEVVPVPPRRPEMLCCLFMALALYFQLSRRALELRRPAILPGLMVMLAIGSKETAMVMPAMIFLVVLLYSPRERWVGRGVHAVVASVGPILATGVMIAARLGVLGGIGGHTQRTLAEIVEMMPDSVRILALNVIFPQPVMQQWIGANWVMIGLVAGLVVTVGLMVAYRRRGGESAEGSGRRPVRTAVVGLVWAVPFLAAGAASGELQPWYLMLPTAGFAIAVGAVSEGLVGGVRRGPRPVQIAAASSLALLVGLMGWQLRYSALVHRYDEYDRATKASDYFLSRLELQIRNARNGTFVKAPPVPMWVTPRLDRPTIRGLAVLSDYSIQAWADLVFSDRRIRVEPVAPKVRKPAQDEVLVLLMQRLKNF